MKYFMKEKYLEWNEKPFLSSSIHISSRRRFKKKIHIQSFILGMDFNDTHKPLFCMYKYHFAALKLSTLNHTFKQLWKRCIRTKLSDTLTWILINHGGGALSVIPNASFGSCDEVIGFISLSFTRVTQSRSNLQIFMSIICKYVRIIL